MQTPNSLPVDSVLRVPTTFTRDNRIRCLQGGLLHHPRRTVTHQTRDLLERLPITTPPHRRPVSLHPIVVKQFLDHGDVDAVQDLVLVGTPIAQEMIDDFELSLEAGS